MNLKLVIIENEDGKRNHHQKRKIIVEKEKIFQK
jgi:hypothetical protein